MAGNEQPAGASAGPTPIKLDCALIQDRSREEIEQRILRIVRSVRFEFSGANCQLRIQGPATGYHSLDPYLSATLRQDWGGLSIDDIKSYRHGTRLYDLCFEDSWSGWFIARHMQSFDGHEDLVLVHLDDHTDMMSTLLSASDGRLVDISTSRPFHPATPEDWETSIASGCIGIGSFITPLYYSGHGIHVRHLNHFSNSNYRVYNVTPTLLTYPLIPGRKFAGIRKRNDLWEQSAGTYSGGADADRLFADLPDGRLLVHIDLDYFINDFNGNPGTSCVLPDLAKSARARDLMEHFFTAMRPAASRIEGWIIATSPGFCSSFHWRSLLTEIERYIDNLTPAGNP